MKRLVLIALAIVCSVSFMNLSAKKPKKPQVDPMQARIDSLKKEAELRKLERELENDLNSTEYQENTYLASPCLDEALDTEEYMGGWGVSYPEANEQMAMRAANKAALVDISSRYLGVIKNGVSEYLKETTTKSQTSSSEGDLEGMANAIGEKAINKYAQTACRRMTKNKKGAYVCYVAVHVPIDKVSEEIAKNMEQYQVLYDREKFQQFMERELAGQAQKQDAQKQREQRVEQYQNELDANK